MSTSCVEKDRHVGTMPNMPKKKEPTAAETTGAKKPSRPGTQLGLWIPDNLGKRLAAFIKASKPRPSKTQTIILALEEFLDRRERGGGR